MDRFEKMKNELADLQEENKINTIDDSVLLLASFMIDKIIKIEDRITKLEE